MGINDPIRIRIHGKGDKWRSCPIWPETAELLKQLDTVRKGDPSQPLFISRAGHALTRFGLYKLVKRYSAVICSHDSNKHRFRISPHVFRHTTAVHLLEAGVDLNVIRGWLGHTSLDTTQRYAEINLRMKQAALFTCLPPIDTAVASPTKCRWHDDQELMKWLKSL